MQNNNYRSLLYFISLVIAVTLAIQLYWNYKNYQAGKDQLANEVQTSVENAIDAYYIELAEKNTIGLTIPNDSIGRRDWRLDSLMKNLDKAAARGYSILDSVPSQKITGIQVLSGGELKKGTKFEPAIFTPITQGQRRFRVDSTQDILTLTSRIIVAISTDTLNTEQLNSYIQDQLSARDLDVRYGYVFRNNSGDTQLHNLDLLDKASLRTQAKSAYLPKNSRFELYFTNIASTILKRNLLGLLLSAVLIAAVVACLFFLLRIINRQKQLAEVKNDLISNITHEFKTPISTVKVALEGIENFNTRDDPQKTRNYLHMSHLQLDKLQMMVEKLLETATLDGESIELQKDRINIADLMFDLVEKHRSLAPDKSIKFNSDSTNPFLTADAFHLENALNNVLDNAVKYGGDAIEVTIRTANRQVIISISDNGNQLTKNEAEQLFEKFYRVPKGNLHNIKGFGIGLYYTKKIIEKHKGTIQLVLKESTNFIISLPYEQ